MKKFYELAEMPRLMEEGPVTYFGCPFHLRVDDSIIHYIADKLIWDAPYRALLFTNSHLFTMELFDKLKSTYAQYSYEYDYSPENYCFVDKSDGGAQKSEVQLFNFSGKKELSKKVKKGYYDRAFFHFVDEDISGRLSQVVDLAKSLSFFTLDSDTSLFYQLGEEGMDSFYRLYDDKSNKKINELEAEDIIDAEKERLWKGLFEKNIK